jgi:hypothetical protein
MHVSKRVKSTLSLATRLEKLQFNEGMEINWMWV